MDDKPTMSYQIEEDNSKRISETSRNNCLREVVSLASVKVKNVSNEHRKVNLKVPEWVNQSYSLYE